LNLPEIANLAYDKGYDINALFSIPENDDWVYSNGKSMVCSSFIIELYKSAGLFGDSIV